MSKPEWPSSEYWEERAKADELDWNQRNGFAPRPQYVIGVSTPIEDIDPEKNKPVRLRGRSLSPLTRYEEDEAERKVIREADRKNNRQNTVHEGKK